MQRLAVWCVSVCLLSALFYGSLSPSSAEPLFNNADKVLHLSAYLVICFWHCLMFPGRKRWVLLACIALGGFIEILQGILGYRDASILDECANTVGSLLGLLVARYSVVKIVQDDPVYN